MIKALAILSLILSLSLPAHARPVRLTSQDPSKPTAQCDNVAGNGMNRTRNCYTPAYGPNPSELGPFVQSHGGAFPPIQVTLSQPTQVKVTYDQLIFLDSELPLGCFSWLPACAAYESAIGIGGADGAHACGFGGGGAAILGANDLDFPAAMAFRPEATCIITLPAGTTAIYALESARNGAFAFNGPGEQLLIVEYDDGL